MFKKLFLLLILSMVCENVNVKEMSVGVGQGKVNPMTDFVRTVNNSLPFVRDVLNSVFGNVNKASFRTVLNIAANIVGAIFPNEYHMPRVPERRWSNRNHDSSIRPYRVEFSKQMISDLRTCIHNRRNITRSLRDTAHTYGTNSEYLRAFLDYWGRDYDFKGREELLNRFPQYVTNIQGLDIHYIHIKPHTNKRVIPLLMLHGWPVTAFEYVHVIDHLMQKGEDSDFVFEIIAPDLPGFGYSEGTNEIGMAPYQMGIIMKNLMVRVGCPRFYIHAGDIGHFAADAIAVLFPDKVLGFHSNFAFSLRPQTLTKYVLGQLYPPAVVQPQYQSRMYPLSDMFRFYITNTGYFHQHATRPDNAGRGLEDSPTGQASWLIENIILATSARNLLEVDGRMPETYNVDDWVDSFTLVWDAQCMTTSMRAYAEYSAWFQDPMGLIIMTTPTRVPFAAIKFRFEVVYQPDEFIKDKYPNLVQSTTLDFGGHFAGYQEPGALADSIWRAVKKIEALDFGDPIKEVFV